jgi:hypothetical protein
MTGFPRAFGPYELLSEVARGASSCIFRARALDGGPEVALKMLREDESGSGAAARFRREAQMAARLRHPNIVPVLDAGESEGRFYYTMPLIEGRPLAAGAASARAAPLLEKVARAVHHAHERGVIHRDLKPTNILVRDDGEPMVTDFGIARDQRRATQLTTAGELLGTPAYMAPEQIAGMAHKADARTDVYALGAVLYFVLTGRPPFDATSFVELSAQVLHMEPPPPRALAAGADPRLEAICLRCLRKNPGDRYASALEMAAALALVARAVPPPRRRLVPLAVVLATTAAAGSFLAGGTREGGSPPRMIRAGEAWVDRCEVTAAEYAEFIAATGRRPPPSWRNGRPPRGREKRPVTHVSRDDAAAYAAWAGKRLPSVEEFRTAAAGIERLAAEDVICAPAALDIGPVDTDRGRDLSVCGALHLAGNVAEWTSTESAAGPRMGVIFGGHWKAPWAQCVRKPEEEVPVDTRDATLGFRCAKPAE